MSKRKQPMPTEAFSMDAFLNDSDDEDLLLLMKPSGLGTTAQKGTSSPLTATSKIIDHRQEENSSSTSVLISQEEGSPFSPSTDPKSPPSQVRGLLQSPSDNMDQQALKDAQRVFQFQTDYKAIHSTSLLKWYAIPMSKKNKKKNSSQYTRVYPCYICPNQQQAMAGHEDEVQISKRNDTLIRYIGYRISYRNKIQAVPSSHLLDFNSCPTGQEQNDAVWCPTFMSMFLNSLGAQHEFKIGSEQERKLKIRTEEQLLHLILHSVLEQEQQLKSNMDGSADDSNSVSDDHGGDISIGSSHWQSPAALPAENKEDSAVKEPAVMEKQKDQESNIRMCKNHPKRLRAGDIVECCPPHVVADKSRLERSRVEECHPGAEVPVKLSSGHWLPNYHQIRIVRRLLRGRYEDCPEKGPFVRISSLILDKSQNHVQKGNGSTRAEHVGKFYKDALQEIASFQSDETKNDVNGALNVANDSKALESSSESNHKGGNRVKRPRNSKFS